MCPARSWCCVPREDVPIPRCRVRGRAGAGGAGFGAAPSRGVRFLPPRLLLGTTRGPRQAPSPEAPGAAAAPTPRRSSERHSLSFMAGNLFTSPVSHLFPSETMSSRLSVTAVPYC